MLTMWNKYIDFAYLFLGNREVIKLSLLVIYWCCTLYCSFMAAVRPRRSSNGDPVILCEGGMKGGDGGKGGGWGRVGIESGWRMGLGGRYSGDGGWEKELSEWRTARLKSEQALGGFLQEKTWRGVIHRVNTMSIWYVLAVWEIH